MSRVSKILQDFETLKCVREGQHEDGNWDKGPTDTILRRLSVDVEACTFSIAVKWSQQITCLAQHISVSILASILLWHDLNQLFFQLKIIYFELRHL